MPKRYLFVYVPGAFVVAIALWISSQWGTFQNDRAVESQQSIFDQQYQDKTTRMPDGLASGQTKNQMSPPKVVDDPVLNGSLQKTVQVVDRTEGRTFLERIKPFLSGDGGKFKNDRFHYRLTPELQAVYEDQFPDDAGHTVIMRSGGYVFFHPNPKAKLPEGSSWVALDENSNVPVVITGRLKVRIGPQASPEGISADYGIEFLRHFKNLSLVFYGCERDDPLEIVKVAKQLEADSRVERVDVEILQGKFVPQ